VSAADGGTPKDAVLLQLGEHSQQISALDKREDAHFADVLVKLGALRGMLREQGEALSALRGLEDAVKQLAGRMETKTCGAGEDEDKYEPIPVVRWWEYTGDSLGEQRRKERDAAVARLRAWVGQIYRPLYGKIADQIGDCWEGHPLALVTLDWLSELWSVLYLTPDRDARQVGQQAEFGTRILPAAAQILADETRGCETHGGGRVNGRHAPGAVRR
jgi:hypothetical protein